MKGYKYGLMLWKDPKAMRDLAEFWKGGKKFALSLLVKQWTDLPSKHLSQNFISGHSHMNFSIHSFGARPPDLSDFS